MPRNNRIETGYPGVYAVESKTVSDGRREMIFYIRYRRDGKMIEEKVGRSIQDKMTAARANKLRGRRIDGMQPSNAEKRIAEQATKATEKAEAERWTITRLWDSYCENHPENKVLVHEKGKFNLYLRDSIGSKDPAELLPLDVDRIRLKLQKAGKRTMSARILEILRRTINYGVKRGLIAPLPFKIEIPKLNNQTTEDLSQGQLKALLSALDADKDQTAADIMRLALYTGMRRSEILKLKHENIDRERGFIRLVDPKGGRDQSIPLNDAARKILDGIQPAERNPYVFPGLKAGTHLTDCRKSFDRIRKAAKLPAGFRPLHGLRHAYASMLASSGQVDLYTLQKLLTHKSPLMTQRYAHLRDDILKRAANVAGNIIEAAKDAEKNAKTK